MGSGASEKSRDGREEEDQNTVQLTHVPTGPPRSPSTCWCDMEVSESCGREMCMWDGARPGLRGRGKGGIRGEGA